MTPDQWFGGAERVLFVHAHPDDETIATGGTLAALAAAGREPSLVTLTRGERGEVREGVRVGVRSGAGAETKADAEASADAETDAETDANAAVGADALAALAAHREGELRGAIHALGVTQHAYLGTAPARATGLELRNYRDSGMEWAADGLAAPAADAGPDALANAPVIELIADLIAAAVHWEIGAVVSYDALGGYRHPDHVRAHQLARAIATGLQIPFWQIVTDRTEGVDHGLESYDVTPWLDQKRAALGFHATQLAVDGDAIVHVGGQRQKIETLERFHRLS